MIMHIAQMDETGRSGDPAGTGQQEPGPCTAAHARQRYM